MIIEEYKSDKTTIRFNDRDIGTDEESKRNVNILISLIVKKISEYS